MQLSLNEYYLWKSNSASRYPWQRKFLNVDFLKYEQRRIKLLSSWYCSYINKDYGSTLEETSFYVIPIELSSSWKSTIAELGYTNYIGLSALQNSPQILLIGLFSSLDTNFPKEYSLIKIRAKKVALINRKLGIPSYAVHIESWESLPSDTIYIDTPHDKKLIPEILKENLTHDEQLVAAFQAPIISAPKVYGSIGGIALSCMAASSLCY